MNAKNGFYYAFGICRRNLGIVGLWPKSNNKKNNIVSGFLFWISVFTIVVFVNVVQTTKLIMIWGNMNEIIDNISTANLPIAIVVFKMFVFRCHKKELESLVSIAKNDWYANKTQRELENMQANAKVAYRMSLICVILGFGSVNGQLAVRICQELNILPGQVEKRLPMISSYFPYDYKPSPIYEISWLIQYAAAMLATIVYSGVYCLFVGLVLHLRGQVANLRLCLENDRSYKETDKLIKREFKKEIEFIVDRHESLTRFAEGIENIFSIMFLAEILSCTVQICLQAFLLVMLISNDDNGLSILQILFMVIYVSHVGTHIFISCYAVDKLRDESLSICDFVYNYQWYDLPVKDARLLLIIMHRAEKPLQVTAGKFCTFSLCLFVQILKTSGGYLSMLLAVKDRISNF